MANQRAVGLPTDVVRIIQSMMWVAKPEESEITKSNENGARVEGALKTIAGMRDTNNARRQAEAPNQSFYDTLPSDVIEEYYPKATSSEKVESLLRNPRDIPRNVIGAIRNAYKRELNY
jgi:hypothetical protein